MGQRLILVALLAALAGLLPHSGVSAATSLTSFTVQLVDLRPGYTVKESVFRNPSNITAQDPMVGKMLLAHGWQQGYLGQFQRAKEPGAMVGQIVDRFGAEAGAHWWYTASLLRVASDYRPTAMPRVGDESTAVASKSYIGIIFRHGTTVVDMYVSLGVPVPRLSVLALARLIDRRLALQPGLQPQMHASHPHPQFLQAWVKPGAMKKGTFASLYAKSVPGARCTATVAYGDGHLAFTGYPRYTGRDGVTWWSWHAITRSAKGNARVTCTYGRQAKTVGVRFTIKT